MGSIRAAIREYAGCKVFSKKSRAFSFIFAECEVFVLYLNLLNTTINANTSISAV